MTAKEVRADRGRSPVESGVMTGSAATASFDTAARPATRAARLIAPRLVTRDGGADETGVIDHQYQMLCSAQEQGAVSTNERMS